MPCTLQAPLSKRVYSSWDMFLFSWARPPRVRDIRLGINLMLLIIKIQLFLVLQSILGFVTYLS